MRRCSSRTSLGPRRGIASLAKVTVVAAEEMARVGRVIGLGRGDEARARGGRRERRPDDRAARRGAVGDREGERTGTGSTGRLQGEGAPVGGVHAGDDERALRLTDVDLRVPETFKASPV